MEDWGEWRIGEGLGGMEDWGRGFVRYVFIRCARTFVRERFS